MRGLAAGLTKTGFVALVADVELVTPVSRIGRA